MLLKRIVKERRRVSRSCENLNFERAQRLWNMTARYVGRERSERAAADRRRRRRRRWIPAGRRICSVQANQWWRLYSLAAVVLRYPLIPRIYSWTSSSALLPQRVTLRGTSASSHRNLKHRPPTTATAIYCRFLSFSLLYSFIVKTGACCARKYICRNHWCW